MRHTWQQIQQTHPDQWVYMKDMQYRSGNLESAVVIFTSKDRLDINRFKLENPDKVPRATAVSYTGEPIEGLEYNDEDIYTDMEICDAF